MWLLDRGYDYEAWQVLQRIGRINGKETPATRSLWPLCTSGFVLDAILKYSEYIQAM